MKQRIIACGLVFLAFWSARPPMHAGYINTFWYASVSQAEVGQEYTMEAYTEFYFANPGPRQIYMDFYRNGSLEEGTQTEAGFEGNAEWSLNIWKTYVENTKGLIEYAAHSYDSKGNSEWLGQIVEITDATLPKAYVFVRDHFNGAVITRRGDELVEISVRFAATERNSNLAGLRTNVWKPDGTLENDAGNFWLLTGYDGSSYEEVERTVTLDQNGTWYFWTEAQNKYQAARNEYSDSGAWHSGFAITMLSEEPRPPRAAIQADRTRVLVGEKVVFTVTGVSPDGNLTGINLDLYRPEGGGCFKIDAPDHVFDGISTPNDGAMSFDPCYINTKSHGVTFTRTGSYNFIGTVADSVRGFHPPGYSAPLAIEVVEMEDTIPPSVPAGLLVAGVKSRQVTINWSASSDNVGVTGYEILLDGVVAGATNSTSYTLDGLSPSTSYEVAVRAMDAAGNKSGCSAPVLITTSQFGPPPIPTLQPDWAGKHGLSVGDVLGSRANDGLGNLAKYYLGLDPTVPCAGASTKGNVLPAAWHALVSADSSRNEAAGATAGDLNVDRSGSVTYTVPLKAVPGSGGVEPGISLKYNSQSTATIAGYGWTISNVPKITRGPKTKFVDNQMHQVDFSYEDQYYLDGQRLIYIGGGKGYGFVAGGHGHDGAEYRTEIETFSKIVAQGHAGNGPESFKVLTKDGWCLIFGGSEDSRLYSNRMYETGDGWYLPMPSPRQEVHTWALTGMIDPFGNAISYTYDKPSPAEQYLKRIAYGSDPQSSMEFEYKSRSDVSFGFVYGATYGSWKILSSITTWYGAKKVRTYDLSHTSGAGGRELLEKITESTWANGQKISLAPTVFTYSDPPMEWVLDNRWAPPEPITKEPGNTVFVDLDGDGRPECIQNINAPTVYLNTPNGWQRSDSWTRAMPSGMRLSACRFVDLNGDGLMDIMLGDERAYLNTGSGFEYSHYWSVGHSTMRHLLNDVSDPKSVSFVDLNGDGRPECIIRGTATGANGNVRLVCNAYINRSSEGATGHYDGSVSPPVWVEAQEPPGTDNAWECSANLSSMLEGNYRACDVTGDGIPDLVNSTLDIPSNNQAPVFKRYAFLSSMDEIRSLKYLRNMGGLDFSGRNDFYGPPEPLIIRDASSIDSEYVQYPSEMVDLNGDGLVDIVRSNISHLDGASARRTWLNTGFGWIRAPLVNDPPVTIAFSEQNGKRWKHNPRGVVFLDINNDGIIDVIEGWGFSLGSAGGGWTGGGGLPWPMHIVDMSEDEHVPPVAYSGSDFVDINGDGAVDMLWHYEEAGEKGAAFNRSVNPNRLVKVENGLGAVTTIDYAPLTATEYDLYREYDDYCYDYPIYTRGEPHPASTPENPIADITPQMQVVRRIKGTEGTRYYAYGGMRMDRMHGNLGFEYFTTIAMRWSRMVTTTRYSQEYPTIGMPVESWTDYDYSGDLSRLSHTRIANGIKSLHGGLTRHVFVADTETSTWCGISDYPIGNQLLSYKATTVDRLGDGADLDDYGNPLRVESVVGQGAEAVTTVTLNTYENRVDPGNWRLGLCTRSVSTASSQAGVLTTTTGAEYDMGTGALAKEVREPQNNALISVAAHYYDTHGNRTETRVSGHGMPGVRVSPVVTYGYGGRFPKSVSNALGQEERHTFDAALGVRTGLRDINGLETRWTHDHFGRVLTETRPDGTVTRNSYRWANRAASAGEVHPFVTVLVSESDGAAPVATFYEHTGRVAYEATIQPRGLHDEARVVGKRTWYNYELGEVWKEGVSYVDGNGQQQFQMTMIDTERDDLGRSYDVYRRQDDEPAEDWMSNYYYRYHGRISTVQTPGRRVELVEKDTLGRVIRRVNNANAAAGSPERGEVLHAYDTLGRLVDTSVIRENGEPATISVDYDLLGRKVAMSDPDTGTWHYTYNAAGELLAQTDPKGQVTAFDYDSLGRMTRRVDADSVTQWSYDTAPNGTGKLATITHTDIRHSSAPVSVESFSYDSCGRLQTHTRRIDGTDYATTQEYDGYGRPSAVTHPGGFRVANLYNNYGYLREVRAAGGTGNLPGDALPNQLFWQAEEYAACGAVTSMSHGNGLSSERLAGDMSGRINSIMTHARNRYRYLDPKIVLQNQHQLFDEVGRVTRRVDDMTGRDERFSYDKLDRLTRWQNSGSAGGSDIEPVPAADVSIAYDALGNIVYKSDVGHYTYSAEHAHGIGQITGGPLGTRNYTYDASGNTLGDGERQYGWTAANKLRRMARGPVASDFAFDHERQRVVQTERKEGGVITTIYASPCYERMHDTQTGLIEDKYYIMTPAGRSAVRTLRSDATAEVRYLHQDALGSVTMVTDEYARVEQRFAYDPWGRRIKTHNNREKSGGGMNRGYTGHEMLEGFDLIHMNARVSDPVTGRFLSADRVVQDNGDSQAYNRYSYCANNPVNATDPTGNYWELAMNGMVIGSMSDEAAAALIRYMVAAGMQVVVKTPSQANMAEMGDEGEQSQMRTAAQGTGTAIGQPAERTGEPSKTDSGRADTASDGKTDGSPWFPGAPDSGDYDGDGIRARSAGCSIVAVQRVQKLFGVKVSSKENIIKAFGLPASNFGENGDGLKGHDGKTVTDLLNVALNPSGLVATKGYFKNAEEFKTINKENTALLLITRVFTMGDHEVGEIPRIDDHMVATTHTNKGDGIIIYNPTGSGGSTTLTIEKALEAQYPINYKGEATYFWTVNKK